MSGIKRTSFNKKRRVKFPVTDAKPPRSKMPKVRLNEKKRASFGKKHKVKFPVEEPGKKEYRLLEKDARKLIKVIFRLLPCPVCRTLDNNENPNTVPHHLLNKGMYEKLRYVIWNLIPLCLSHHRWPHGNKKQEFLNWLLDFMPEHYRYRKNEKPKKNPHKPTVEELRDIVNYLQYLADNPEVAERIIYEHD